MRLVGSGRLKGLQRLVDIWAARGDIHDITFNHAKTVYVFAIGRQLYSELATYFLELAKNCLLFRSLNN